MEAIHIKWMTTFVFLNHAKDLQDLQGMHSHAVFAFSDFCL